MIRYTDVVATTINGVLKPLAGATISVSVSGTSTAANIYDELGAPAQNPVTADSLGRFHFYCHTGIYDLTIAHDDVEPWTVPAVLIGDGQIHAQHYGDAIPDSTTDSAAGIQAAIDRAAAQTADAWTTPGASSLVVDLDGGSYLVGAPIEFASASYSRIKLCNGQLIADTSADWGDDGSGNPTRYVIELTGDGVSEVTIEGLNIVCGKATNGILVDVGDGAFNRVTGNTITNFGAYGINIESAAGTFVENNVVTEWLSDQTEFDDDAAYVGTACRIGDADQKVFRNVFRWSGCNLRMDAGTAMVSANHLYNGRFNGTPRVQPCNMIVYGYGNLFTGNYIGNGEVRLYNTNQVFDGNRHSGNTTASTLRAMYCLMAQSVDDKVNALRITNGMLTNEQQEDATGYRYITLVEEDGFNFVDRDSAFLLRDKASDINVTGGAHIFTRTGLLSKRVAEFRGHMATALISCESSTSTDNDNLPGFGTYGDSAVIATNGTNWVHVSPDGFVGLRGEETTYKLGVYTGSSQAVKIENTSELGTADIELVGSREVQTENVGVVLVTDKTFGPRAAFSGRTVTSTTTGGMAVVSSATSGVLTDRWAVDHAGALRPWVNNAVDIGTGSFRVKDLYLANAPNVSSDERLKTDIADSDLGLAFIDELRPVKYRVAISANPMIPGDPVTETVQVQVTRPEQYESIEVVDDQAVLTIKTRQVPVYDTVPVVDANGDPVYTVDEEGNQVQRTYLVPRMEEVEREVPSLVPDEVAGARTHYGMIAQEVQDVLEALSVPSFAGWGLADPGDPNSLQHLRYEQFIAPLIKAVQELSDRVAVLEGAP